LLVLPWIVVIGMNWLTNCAGYHNGGMSDVAVRFDDSIERAVLPINLLEK
jgi:hypothetical protein